MSAGIEVTLAEAGAAFSIGDFEHARALATEAVADSESPDARILLGMIDCTEERVADAHDQWQLAFHAYRDRDDFRGAAKAATFLGMLQYDALGNESASRGWLSRAARLLERSERCVERGYLELALVACNVRDVSALEESAAVALDLAIEFHDSDLEARALADGGLALISQGRLAEGFARLDEAMVPVSNGEIHNPLMGGTILCALLTACERTGEMRRAAEWSQTAQQFATARLGDFAVMHTHCRLAYGTVLCDAGRWPEAEAEMLAALGPPSTSCVPKLAESAAALANLRLLQGRPDDAAAILAPYEDRFEVLESVARLHQARGALDQAVAVIDRALHELVGDRLRAGRLLHLLVEIELARGDIGGASGAAERLYDYADESDSAILSSMAKLSDARVARKRGDVDAALTALDGARQDLAGEQRPMLEAGIGLELAAALADAGSTAAAIDEARAALTRFTQLGVPVQVDRAVALLQELGESGVVVPVLG